MAEIIGRQVEMGVAIEAARGTAEVVADKWGRKVTANVVERAVHSVDETTRGGLEDAQSRRVVQTYIEGDMQGILHTDTIGFLFSNLYGAVVSAQVAATTVYTHTFNLQQNIQHQALTLFAKDGSTQQQTFSNAMVSTLEIAATQEDHVRFTAGFIASAAAANADTPSYDTEYDFIARDIVIKIAVNEAGLTGATAIKAKEVSIKWDAGLIRDHVVGARTPDDTYNSKMMIEGTMTLNFDDTTFKAMYLDDTEQYMRIKITGEEDIDSGNFPDIDVLLHKIQITDWNRAGESDGLVTQDVSFRAFYNPVDAKQSEVVLQNITTTYPGVPTS